MGIPILLKRLSLEMTKVFDIFIKLIHIVCLSFTARFEYSGHLDKDSDNSEI